MDLYGIDALSFRQESLLNFTFYFSMNLVTHLIAFQMNFRGINAKMLSLKTELKTNLLYPPEYSRVVLSSKYRLIDRKDFFYSKFIDKLHNIPQATIIPFEK